MAKDGEHHLPETAYYECEHCHAAIRDSDKPEMLSAGMWVASRPEIKGIAGFHINSIYSPWVKFEKLVAEWVDVNKGRDKKA